MGGAKFLYSAEVLNRFGREKGEGEGLLLPGVAEPEGNLTLSAGGQE